MESPRAKIGQYVISKKLGEGGMGAVFLGEHEFTGRPAAIKMISGGHFESEDSIQRLKDEARALSVARTVLGPDARPFRCRRAGESRKSSRRCFV